MAKIRINEISGVALLLFTVSLLGGIAVAQATHQEAYGIAGALVGLYFLFAIKVIASGRRSQSCASDVTSACVVPASATSYRSWKPSAHMLISECGWPVFPQNPR